VRDQADRTNLLNPTKKPEVSYLQKIMATFSSPTVAVSDNMRIISDQISPWVPHGLLSLGTDGFGRSDTRENLRQFFEVDEAMIVLACITQLKKCDNLTDSTFSKIYKSLNISPKKNHPFRML